MLTQYTNTLTHTNTHTFCTKNLIVQFSKKKNFSYFCSLHNADIRCATLGNATPNDAFDADICVFAAYFPAVHC